MTNRYDRGISLTPEVFPPQPELRQGWIPEWCNGHALGMRLIKEGEEGHEPDKVLIKGSAAELAVSKHPKYDTRWVVEWRVVQAIEEYTQGRTVMVREDLGRAFGLSDEPGNLGRSILNNHGGTTAYQGKYLRWNNFLNIPGPGTGHDGDPNISIELNDDIKNAVKKMINPLSI